MFQTNPNSNNNNNEDATRPVVARATHLAKLATYPDFTDAAADIDMDIYPLWFSVQQVPADLEEDEEPSMALQQKMVSASNDIAEVRWSDLLDKVANTGLQQQLSVAKLEQFNESLVQSMLGKRQTFIASFTEAQAEDWQDRRKRIPMLWNTLNFTWEGINHSPLPGIQMPIEHFAATSFFTRVKLLVELGAIPGVKTKKVIDLYNDMSRASIRAIPLPPQTTDNTDEIERLLQAGLKRSEASIERRANFLRKSSEDPNIWASLSVAETITELPKLMKDMIFTSSKATATSTGIQHEFSSGGRTSHRSTR